MNHNDPYDRFPSTGIEQAELATMYLSLVDAFLRALVKQPGLDAVNDALDLPEGYDGTTEDGDLDAAGFIRTANAKLRLLQRLVHAAMAKALTSTAERKMTPRGAYGNGPTPAEIGNARRWLKAYEFDL